MFFIKFSGNIIYISRDGGSELKRKFFISGIAILLLLTGCSESVDLSAQNNDLVAEYAAGIMINHSYSYKNRYIEEETMEEETTEENALIDPLETTAEEEEESVSNIFECSNALGMDFIQITYMNYNFKNEYPDSEDALFTFSAEPGYQFLIVDFLLKNTTQDSITVNTLLLSPVFRLTVNNYDKYNNYGTLLLNDLSNLDDFEIAGDAEVQVELVFMIEEEKVAEITSMQISLIQESTPYPMITILQ